jgi:hypothetical protein
MAVFDAMSRTSVETYVYHRMLMRGISVSEVVAIVENSPRIIEQH